jgi:hypothetical protein
LKLTKSISIKDNFKFSFGGLTPSTKMLRMIEEISNTDVELDSSFNAYSTCSGKSMHYLWKVHKIKPIKFALVDADECQTAADIYQCGRQEAPDVTSAIFAKEAERATVQS